MTRPVPRTSVTPRPVMPSAARRSSPCRARPSRRATAAAYAAPSSPSGTGAAAPPRPASRRAWFRACALASIALLGMHATYGHSPPTRSRSTSAADPPASAIPPATHSPAEPAPSTTTSNVMRRN